MLVLARLERARGVVEAFRLGGVDLGVRRARLDGERDAGRKPTARRTDHDHFGCQPEHGQILHDLASGRALTGYDEGVVIRRHERRAALLRNLARDRLAVFPVAIIQHHLGAERGRAVALRLRRI